jgi:hypothetical protein
MGKGWIRKKLYTKALDKIDVLSNMLRDADERESQNEFSYWFFSALIFPVFVILAAIGCWFLSGMYLTYPFITPYIQEYWTTIYAIYLIIAILLWLIKNGPRIGDI